MQLKNNGMYLSSVLLLVSFTLVRSNTCPIALPCKCEDGSRKGRVINCRDKQLTQIPEISFSSEVFYELTFSSSQEPLCSICNRITAVPDNAFSNITIKRLDLGKNPVNQYSNGAFNGLENNLTELILYGDKSKAAPFTAMQHLSRLTMLHLQNFTQGHFDNTNTFGDFPDLETLKLKYLELAYIAGSSFQNKLTKLKRLEIVGNPQMLTVPVAALRQLVTLEHLSFIQNGITKIPSLAFQTLSNLIELDLQHNGFNVLEDGCFNGTEQKLAYLGLSINNLNQNQLNPLIQGNWSKLQQLILSHNQLSSLPNGLFRNMKMLAYVNLDSNQLSSIQSTTFQESTNMHEIDLATNEITFIEPGTFANLRQLKILDITYQSVNKPNNILNLTRQSVQGLEGTLVELRLEKTAVVENTAWDAIKALRNLRVLKISKTKLHYIEDFVFENHVHLKYLDISGTSNNITQVTQKSFHGLKNSLETLDLSNNFIQQIDKCVFQSFTKLKDIYLTANPLHCDCGLIWLYDWIKQRIASDPTFFPMIAACKSPSSLAGQSLHQVNRNSLTCDAGYSPPICQDYYVTTTISTTTPSMTTTPTTTVATPTLILSVASSAQDKVKLSWSVDDKSKISRYTVTYQKLGVSSSKKSISVDRDQIQFEIEGLDAGSQYEVCIYALLTNLPPMQPMCKIARTSETTSKAPQQTDEGLHPGVIAGIVIGVVLAILIIIAFMYILIKTNQRQKRSNLPPPVIDPRSFAPVGTPRTGYDSKRFSKPKKNTEQNEKDLQVNVISTGKTGDEMNRVSAGSYQFLNERQRLSQEPMPSSSKMSGANGTRHDVIPTRHSGGRYVNEPSSPPPPYNLYANDRASQPRDHYVNNVDSRPLPKKPYGYENNSSGFLNHGFSPESSADHHYHEIKDTVI